MNILYIIENSIYVNIINICLCSCVFCIRNEKDEVVNSGSLWLEYELSVDEVKEVFNKYNLDDYDEIVFCGYGELLMRINELIEVVKFIKEKSSIKIRININGLSDLIYNKKIVILLKNVIDVVLISFNVLNKEVYNRVI